jgi:hypothetical protein
VDLVDLYLRFPGFAEILDECQMVRLPYSPCLFPCAPRSRRILFILLSSYSVLLTLDEIRVSWDRTFVLSFP